MPKSFNNIDKIKKKNYNINVAKIEGEDIMLAKYWKRIGFIILIVACVFNVMGKLVNKLSLNKEMIYSATFMQEEQKNNNKYMIKIIENIDKINII